MKKEAKPKKYKCVWPSCIDEPEFVVEVFYDSIRELSSQVKCPKCCNFIPTWKKEETGNTVGQKHRHIRKWKD